jgi:hypothetical protein
VRGAGIRHHTVDDLFVARPMDWWRDTRFGVFALRRRLALGREDARPEGTVYRERVVGGSL